MNRHPISFTLNGKTVKTQVEARTTLLRALRDLGVLSVKRGCEEGECGTCTVLIDGTTQKSCMVLAMEVEGRTVTTCEGLLAPDGELHPIQQAFIDEGAIQCGYCTPGMIMATYALLERSPDPADEEIRAALAGNLCRCTGYVSIFRAVKKAAGLMKRPEGAGKR